MAVARAERTTIVHDDADDVFVKARGILAEVGTVSFVDRDRRFLQGTARQGLRTVRIGIAAAPIAGGTSLLVEATTEGPGRGVLRKCLDRVMGAIEHA